MPPPNFFKGLGKKISKGNRRIFGKRSPEISISIEAPIARSQSPSGTTHLNRLDSSAEGHIQQTTANNAVTRDNSASPTPSHPSEIDTTEATSKNNVEITRPDSRRNMNRQYPADNQTMDNIETAQVIEHNKPIISDNPSLGLTAGNENENKSGSVIPESGQPQTAMFNGQQNQLITGGTFVQHINMNRRGLKPLQKRVATAAFHNSAERFNPPRCHPGTRVAILQRIYDWIIQSDNREKWLLWLNGAAGAGKSAIIQSITEQCANAATRLAVASFFFFRADTTRNIITPLVATLTYQLVQAIPELSDDILLTIERHPLIFDQSLETQLQQLIVQPLLRLSEHLHLLFVVLVDGLDECNNQDDQSNLIKVFADISRLNTNPIIFLITSRREPEIEAAFVHKQISNLILKLPLDNKSDVEQTSSDIQRFLTDKFNDIKESHLHRGLLPSNWPPEEAVEEIVTKSSGQFIYASVVVNYVSSPRANPSRQLEIIRDLKLLGPSSKNPFAHLDALYQHIFSRVEALDEVLDILAFILITSDYSNHNIELVFLLRVGQLQLYFADLAPIIECEHSGPTLDQPKIRLLHASLPDFLLDESRSEKYHINIDEYRTKLLCMFLKRDPPQWKAQNENTVSTQMSYHLSAIKALLESGAKASVELQRLFANFEFTPPRGGDCINATASSAMVILSQLKALKFNDQDKAYHHVLGVLTVEIAENWLLISKNIKSRMKESPDLLASVINEMASSAIEILLQLNQPSSDDHSQTHRHILDVLAVEIAENWHLVAKAIKNRIGETPDLRVRIVDEIAILAIARLSQLKESVSASSDDSSQADHHVLDVSAVKIAENWHLVANNIKSRVKETSNVLVHIINEVASSVIVILPQLKESNSHDQSQAYRRVSDMSVVEIAENWHFVSKNIKSRVEETPKLFARIINEISSLAIVILLQLKELSSEDQDQANRHVLDMLAVKVAENWHFVAKNIKRRVKDTPALFARIIDEITSSTIVILSQLKESVPMSSEDQSQAYHHVFEVLAIEIAENWTLVSKDTKSRVKETPNLLARISQIRQEEIK